MLSSGAPVDMAVAGDLQAEIAYSNHPNSESYTAVIHAKIGYDIVNGHALAFKRSSIVSDIRDLCVSPLGAVEDYKLRIIHDLAFAGDGYC